MDNVTPKLLYKSLVRSWYYGIAFYMGFTMLIQDYLGLEGYIEFVRTHWTDLHWIVGLLIAACGIFLEIGMLVRWHWLNIVEFNVKENSHD